MYSEDRVKWRCSSFTAWQSLRTRMAEGNARQDLYTEVYLADTGVGKSSTSLHGLGLAGCVHLCRMAGNYLFYLLKDL